jgi:ParB family chromosome partitioning protein
VELELDQLDLRYEVLRVRHTEREGRLLASLAADGQQAPIVVVAAGERYVVVDGFRRVRALRQLHRDVARATVWDMGEAEALLLTRSLRTGEGESALEQGWLLEALHRTFGMSQDTLARSFGRSSSWVSRRLALVEELPQAVQELVREGRIGAHVAMRCLAPMARATVDDCQTLASSIAGARLSSREAARVYEAWCGASRQARRRLVAEPLLYLRAHRHAQGEDGGRPSQPLLEDLELVARLARRTVRRWSEATAELPPSERRAVELLVRQAAADLRLVERRLEEGVSDADCRATGGDPGACAQRSGDASDRARPGRVEGGGQGGDPVAVG